MNNPDIFTILHIRSGTLPDLLERVSLVMVALLTGLLIGFGAGYMAPSLERKAASEVVIPKVIFKTAYARTACIGHPILNAQSGWSVVFEPGEC